MLDKEEEQWFVNWFNTPFYHDLYRHRNDHEAIEWMQKIADIIPLQKQWPILDVCCGNGRHGLYLEKLGFIVHGIDIGAENIAKARQNSQFPDRWVVGDARTMEWNQSFQLVTNLFTSFGYFDNHRDNENLMHRMQNLLAKNGFILIDFLNAKKVIKDIVHQETIQGELTQYSIQRSIEEGQIIKKIGFQYNHQDFIFQEKVYLYDTSNFLQWFDQHQFQLIHHFGDYSGNVYQEDSPRSIFVFQRK